MPTCPHGKLESSDEHYARVIYGTGPLFGPWNGWRTAGRYLIAPTGERFTPGRLRGWAWRQQLEERVNRSRSTAPRPSWRLVEAPIPIVPRQRKGRAQERP